MFGTHAQLPGNGVDRTWPHPLGAWAVSVLHLEIPFLIFNAFALFLVFPISTSVLPHQHPKFVSHVWTFWFHLGPTKRRV